jgi:hypothetical protein
MANGVGSAAGRSKRDQMPKQIRLNAFDMNCVGHQSPGLWTHPRDRSDRYNTMRVSLKDILEAFEFVSADSTGEHQAFLCRQSGKVYWYVEYSDDELSELPDDIDDREKYVQIPDKKELDLGKPLVLEFVRRNPAERDG